MTSVINKIWAAIICILLPQCVLSRAWAERNWKNVFEFSYTGSTYTERADVCRFLLYISESHSLDSRKQPNISLWVTIVHLGQLLPNKKKKKKKRRDSFRANSTQTRMGKTLKALRGWTDRKRRLVRQQRQSHVSTSRTWRASCPFHVTVWHVLYVHCQKTIESWRLKTEKQGFRDNDLLKQSSATVCLTRKNCR